MVCLTIWAEKYSRSDLSRLPGPAVRRRGKSDQEVCAQLPMSNSGRMYDLRFVNRLAILSISISIIVIIIIDSSYTLFKVIA